MISRHQESLALYRWLLSWGEKELAYGECGEGVRRARSLMADCHSPYQLWVGKRETAVEGGYCRI